MTRAQRTKETKGPLTLAVDVGGTGVKAVVLRPDGRPVGERLREPTPHPATPRAVLATIEALARRLEPFDRVSIGFPGVVTAGVVRSAPNLADRAWRGHDVAADVTRRLGKPVRARNDAVVQGLGAIRGRGVEMVVTLGTGMGSALFVDGRPAPLELGHHPWRGGKTYEERLSDAARRRVGHRRWSRRARRALDQILAVFLPDVLYVGGGNAARIRGALPASVRIVDNVDGLLGGIRLWDAPDGAAAPRVRARAPRVSAGELAARPRRRARR